MTQEYSPLRSPRSRSVVAMVERARQGKHRGGQRKVSEIVEENNRLIRTILGLPEPGEEQTVAAGVKASPATDPGAEAALAEEVRSLEAELSKAAEENLGLERELETKTSDARHYERLSDKLLSYLTEDEHRSVRKHPFAMEIERLGDEVAAIATENESLCRELDGFERDLEHELEPRGERTSRERWVQKIARAAEIDYGRVLGGSGATTSGRSDRPGALAGAREGSCVFVLEPARAEMELARLREALNDLGRKVLVVEKARDAAYLENDYIDVKIRKVNGQSELAREKLEAIRVFQKKLEEMQQPKHEENVLRQRRERAGSELLVDRARQYKPEFEEQVDAAVAQARSVLSPLLHGGPEVAGREGPDEEEEDRAKEEEGGGERRGRGESVLSPLLSDPPEPPVAGTPVAEEPPPTLASPEDLAEEAVLSNDPKGETGRPTADEGDATPAPDLPFESSSATKARSLEMGTQTPVGESKVQSRLDFAAHDDNMAAAPSAAPKAPATEEERIHARLFEIRRRKALALRDLSTGTLRELAEEALEEKDLYKRLKRLSGGGGRSRRRGQGR
ncbi:hypothetical protein HKI87_07g46400 [Chloropicon roscoffensis]|uniref:Uncharacterized protein n=1 Tax=Chloropicon roscoffensis TaxID=1461544 RepID=A0AAX4PBZ4_9CHLO